MGGRRISIQDPDRIVDDWPATGPVGRERRKQEYREQREALKPEKPAEPVRIGGRPYPGYVSPEEMFPKWDWLLKPWGPPLDDPLVKAYIEVQRKAAEKWARSQKRASA